MCVEVCMIVPQPGVIFRRFNESKHNVCNGTVLCAHAHAAGI